MYVIGIDPGPIPGIVRLELADRAPTKLLSVEALQVTPGVLTTVLAALSGAEHTAIGAELFVVGRRAARSSTPKAGAKTRNLLGEIEAWAIARLHSLYLRSAAQVKPWATDERLDAIGLLELTKGMRHARDGGRHALFTAVESYGLPDPLSRKAGGS